MDTPDRSLEAQIIDPEQMAARSDEAAAMLKALAHPGRLRLLCRLVEGECPAGELEATARLGQSAVSQHLALLRGRGLVVSRRRGTQLLYRLADPDCGRLLALLHEIYCSGKNKKQD